MRADFINTAAECSAHPSQTWRIFSAAINAVKKLNNEMQRRRRIHADKAVLMSLSEHMLHDIGIRRSEIDYVVRNGREIDRIRTKEVRI